MLEQFLAYSGSEAPPLKVGLLLDGFDAPEFALATLKVLRASNFARLAAVVSRASTPTPPAQRSFVEKVSRRFGTRPLRRRILFDAYLRWDSRNTLSHADPTGRFDARDLFADLPLREVIPVSEGFNHRLADEDIAWLRSHDLDVLIRFGFNILKGEVLKVARYGVWSFHHGDNDEYRGGPAHLWELIEQNPVSGVILQVLNERLDDGLVLMKGRYQTERGRSLVRNRVRPYEGSSFFLLQKLLELHRDGWDAVASRAVPPQPYRGRARIYRTPTNGQMVAWAARSVGAAIRRRLTPWRNGAQHWELGFYAGAVDPFRPLVEYRCIPSPPGEFWADPCVVAHGDDTLVFFEAFDEKEGRGRLCVGRFEATSGVVEVRTVLQTPYHLSYPQVFRHDGEWWMLPESADAGSVVLWRATRFPDEWEPAHTLLSLRAVDTTPHQLDDGRWLFFTTLLSAHGGAWTTCLFRAPELGAPWEYHPSNPISTSVDFARSAGRLVAFDGALYRPVQDCRRGYGLGLRWMRVEAISYDRYVERFETDTPPAPDADGAHTYSAAGPVQFVDVTTRRRR
jgi:hypothetical protein